MSCDNKSASTSAPVAGMLGTPTSTPASTEAKAASALSDFTANDLGGKPVNLKDFAGKVCIVVNVATLCGYTVSNYTQLNELVAKYKDKDLQVLAFPCNQVNNSIAFCIAALFGDLLTSHE